jgi:tRNA A37 threonylcarbamoyladenosine biosynthesis protein TsaE
LIWGEIRGPHQHTYPRLLDPRAKCSSSPERTMNQDLHSAHEADQSQKSRTTHGDPTSAKPTTLVKGIARALDATDPDEVTSPTFTLVHE